MLPNRCHFHFLLDYLLFSLRFYYVPDNLLPDFSMHATQNTLCYTCQKITTETTMKFIALDSRARTHRHTHTPPTPTLPSSCQSGKKNARRSIRYCTHSTIHIRMPLVYFSLHFFRSPWIMIDDDTTKYVCWIRITARMWKHDRYKQSIKNRE